MSRSFCKIAAFCLSAHLALAGAAELEAPESPAAQELRACAGMNNEATKKRELLRELAIYLGQTVPDELRDRARKYFDQVIKLREECESAKRLTAAAK